VSELMTFEEELGGKNVGVQPSSGADGDNHNGGPGAGRSYNANYGVAAGGGCGGHVRESLPPAFSQTQSSAARRTTRSSARAAVGA
jgi:dual specificity MAP kinase phosphatase